MTACSSRRCCIVFYLDLLSVSPSLRLSACRWGGGGLPALSVCRPFVSRCELVLSSTAWFPSSLCTLPPGPYGSSESVDTTGQAVCAAGTWDAKASHLVAVLGGLVDPVRAILTADGKLSQFTNRIESEWSRVFTTINGESVDLALPSVPFPKGLAPFTACT